MADDKKTLWQRSKLGFDKLWAAADKLGAPVNKLSNKIGSEAFWPTSIDKESDKAARILRSFCKDGIYTDEVLQTVDGPKKQQKVLKKIPTEVIKKAKGLAIFTTMRTGLWFSGAGGSGIVVARLPDGSWSPPSGILLHTAAIGFLVGVDIYDCVLVLNTDEAVAAFSRWRATVGGEISAVAGPVGVGGILDTELHKRQAPIFTYLRSRGFYAGVQIDGTVIIERNDENEKFYGYKYSSIDILTGKVRHPPWEIKTLMQTLKAAQGDTDVDESALPTEPPPADFDVVKSDHIFGVPDKEDPDPFGIHALEKEGLVIKEASTQMAAAPEEFDFKPAITSPVYSTYNKTSQRGSFESSTHRTSWRSSALSINSVDKPKYVTMDISTQTDFPSPPLSNAPGTPTLPVTPEHEEEDETVKINTTPNKSTLPGQEMRSLPPLPIRASPEGTRRIPPPLPLRIKPTYASASTSTSTSAPAPAMPTTTPVPAAVESVHSPETVPEAEKDVVSAEQEDDDRELDLDEVDLDGEDEEEDDEEEPVEVVEVQQVQARPVQALRPQMISAGSGPRVVTVGPRSTPPVPSRNPFRAVRASSGATPSEEVDGASTMTSEGSAPGLSPTSQEHDRKESVTSHEASPTTSIKAKSPSVRSVGSFKSTQSTQVGEASQQASATEAAEEPIKLEDVEHIASEVPGGFPVVKEPTPSPPALDIPQEHDVPPPFEHSPVDPKNRISMANMRLGLGLEDEEDARSPSPSGRKFSIIQSPSEEDHMQFA